MQSTTGISPNAQEWVEPYVVPETVAENIRQALRGLQFGEIVITVRNGNVIQIERIARKRQFKSS